MAIIFEQATAPDPVSEAAERFAEAAMASERTYRPSELVEIVAEKIALAIGPLAEGWFDVPVTPEELELDAADLERNATKNNCYEEAEDKDYDLERARTAIARGEKQLAKIRGEEKIAEFKKALAKLKRAEAVVKKTRVLDDEPYTGD